MKHWPEIHTRVLYEGVLGSEDDPDSLVNLFQEDRVAIMASTRIDGRKVVAMQVLAPGLHRQVDLDLLVSQVEPSLRQKIAALAEAK